MSYRQSRARREFERQIKAAIHELAPIYKYANKRGSGSRLLAAYYVFAYSQLEVYIKSFVEDALNALNSTAPAFDKYPDLLLGYLLHSGEKLAAEYQRYGVTDDEGAILQKLADTARKVASWKTGGTTVASANATEFLEKKKYPSPKNLPQLFRRLGILQIWAVASRAGRMNSELILTSLNDLRTGIAHEGRVPPGFSMSDFRDRIDQMSRFVAALDRGVASHFCAGPMTRMTWNGKMS